MYRQSQFSLNIEAIFVFLFVATIECVSPFGFHHVGIVSPKQPDSKFYNAVIEPLKTETNEIPVWKKFHFWKKKRNFWSDEGFDPNSRFQPEFQTTGIYNPKSEGIFNEPEPLESLQSLDTGSISDGFDPELELSDMFTEPDTSGPDYWSSDVLPVDVIGQNDGFGILQDEPRDIESPPQTEGFINPGPGDCVKSISLQGTTSCLTDQDCKDCHGIVFHCAMQFCKLGPAPSCGKECDITDTFPSFFLKR